MKALIIGGAGYIGSQVAKFLTSNNYSCLILDDLSTGYKALAGYGEFVQGSLNDISALDTLFSEHKFDAVLHFAARSLVSESVSDPEIYYHNNVTGVLNLLHVMKQYQVKNLVFSSTAAVYGNPIYTPIDEEHPKMPINPYGKTKLVVEEVLKDYAQAYGLNSVCLRYFNAAGADPDVELGECHEPETHLIPLILKTALGLRDSITVFGTDYETEDGTCVRDYIHVQDLAYAHFLALEKLLDNSLEASHAFNLGYGRGYSINEVIALAQSIVAEDAYKINIKYGDRRLGDPAVLVANADKARLELGWQPNFNHLETIIRHAWAWEKYKLSSGNF